MPINYNKLKGRIVEKCGTQGNFAREMGLSERTVSLRLSGKIPFKQPEIVKALEILDLTGEDVQAYFFAVEVKDF